MKTPEVSYVVSLYHRPEYLAVCLWSLIGQTHQDFEIVVTDNSEDDSFAKRHQAIIKSIGDPRIKYVRTYKKIKVADCYWSAEYGVRLAKGKWLCFPCEDCYYPPEWTQRMLTGAVRGNWELALCESIVVGPDTCGADRYMHLDVGTKNYPGYKPSFLIKSSRFKGWLNKPVIPAVSGVDRTTLRDIAYDPNTKWGTVRDLFYVHN
jgi:glycosyltransferase involved in cell wall biosynthesis